MPPSHTHLMECYGDTNFQVIDLFIKCILDISGTRNTWNRPLLQPTSVFWKCRPVSLLDLYHCDLFLLISCYITSPWYFEVRLYITDLNWYRFASNNVNGFSSMASPEMTPKVFLCSQRRRFRQNKDIYILVQRYVSVSCAKTSINQCIITCMPYYGSAEGTQKSDLISRQSVFQFKWTSALPGSDPKTSSSLLQFPLSAPLIKFHTLCK